MTSVKQRLGVAPRLASCHTAVIDGKFVEGHVPAAQVIELSKRNDLVGIAVPGMPAGSPGMEAGGTQHAYQVTGLTKAGDRQSVGEGKSAAVRVDVGGGRSIKKKREGRENDYKGSRS